MVDHATDTAHADRVRVAVRDQFGATDAGGPVSLGAAGVTENARRTTVNRAAAHNGQPGHPHTPADQRPKPRDRNCCR
jgi:hypothetical protein